MTTAIVVEIRPAQPIRRLVAPSSASTKVSAFCSASSEIGTTSSLGDDLPDGRPSVVMLPPKRSYAARQRGRDIERRIHAGLREALQEASRLRLSDDACGL